MPRAARQMGSMVRLERSRISVTAALLCCSLLNEEKDGVVESRAGGDPNNSGTRTQVGLFPV